MRTLQGLVAGVAAGVSAMTISGCAEVAVEEDNGSAIRETPRAVEERTADQHLSNDVAMPPSPPLERPSKTPHTVESDQEDATP